MYSGFISSKRTVSALGIHQRFDSAAYRMLQPYLTPKTFPTRRQILHFEGINGPDGLKVKSPGQHEPSHLYNPQTGKGQIPELIIQHYGRLVPSLQSGDLVRSAFEAAWMAHYICDGLTPAHHYPLDEKLAEVTAKNPKKTPKGRVKYRVAEKGGARMDTVRRGWAIWGGKGLMTTHFNFEMGIAVLLLGARVRSTLDSHDLARARQIGPVEFFKQEAADVARLRLYEKFYEAGWTAELARLARRRLAPQIAQTIGIMWLLAYLEAGMESVKADAASARAAG